LWRWGFVVIEAKVTGVGDLRKVARRIEEGGGPVMRRELSKALRRATEPAKRDVRAAALAVLPKRGRLAGIVARATISTRTSLRGPNPSVRMTGRWSGHDLARIDRGDLRHPVFADSATPRSEWTWVSQKVPAGFWTKTLRAHARRTQHDVTFAVREVSRMVVHG